MKSKVIAFLELASNLRQTGLNLIRVAILIVFVWIGGLKFTHYEADGIVPFVANSPFMSFFYAKEAPEYKQYKNKEGEDAEDNRIVFVTKTGQVYHTSNICSHIKISVREVDFSSVNHLRNKGGAKYYPCEYCARGKLGGIVYITSEGNRVHKNKTCPGIKRTVTTMKKTEAEARGLRPCERCGKIHD